MRERFDLVENFAIGINEVEAGDGDGENGGGEEGVDVAADTIVNAGYFFIGAFFGFVVAFEQLRHANGESFLAGEQIGRGEYANDTGVTLLGGSEDVIEVAPEIFEGFDELGVLVGLTGEGIGFLFFFDAVLQIGAEMIEGGVSLVDGLAFGATTDTEVAHVAKLESDGADITLDADEEARIVTVQIDGVGLKATKAVELEESIGGKAGHGGQGDQQAQQESECG